MAESEGLVGHQLVPTRWQFISGTAMAWFSLTYNGAVNQTGCWYLPTEMCPLLSYAGLTGIGRSFPRLPLQKNKTVSCSLPALVVTATVDLGRPWASNK